MIDHFATLQRVKRLREDKALRALEKARQALAETIARRDRLDEELAASANAMPARERAIFDSVLRNVVGLDRIDQANADVQELRNRHQQLADALDRARDAVRRAVTRLEDARRLLRQKQQEVEKIDIVAGGERERIEAARTMSEEAEIEELFARPSGLVASVMETRP